MKNKLFLVLISVPLIALFLWTAHIEMQYRNMPRVKIAVEGYDQRDLLSGHYMQLRLDWEKTNCEQFIGEKCPIDMFDYTYRFYLDENYAQDLDRLVRASDMKWELEFAYVIGKEPLIKELYIDGITWKEWIEKNK